MKNLTFVQVISNFKAGMADSEDGAISATNTLRIKGDQLIHYWTPIAERYNGKIIVNVTRYSLVTGRLQKQLKELIPEDQYIAVKGIPEGYKGTLTGFLPQN